MENLDNIPAEKHSPLDGEERVLPEAFVHALLSVQERLYAYLLTLLQDSKKAEEVLQETNLVLCRQSDQFETVSDFTGWACRIAYYEVLTYRKRQQRDRHAFSDQLLEKIAEQTTSKVVELDRRKAALDHCLSRLSARQRNMIMRRYDSDGSVKVVAEEYGRSAGSISQSLYRIRTTLMKCIQQTLVTLD